MSLHSAYRGQHGDRNGWWLEFGFNFNQIQRLKDLVPFKDDQGQARAWCEERGEHGEWWVAQEYVERLTQIWPALSAHLWAVPLPGFET